ncbi:MAG: Hypothetical protein AJITA_00272 [Acetilactobacillus jinshanensis]
MNFLIRKKKKLSPAELKYNVGDQVAFTLDKQKFVGRIDKRYINSFLISFHSDDPEIVDKYHNKTVVNNQKLKLIKAAPKKKTSQSADKKSKKINFYKQKRIAKISNPFYIILIK